ncbi:MAG: DUF4249 family protein [candidate division WOR-3 bacterium]|nr:DUF4249 family protein [candidate division WOR-3 bacterium]
MAEKSEAKSQKAKAKTGRGLWLVACGLWLVLVACEVVPSEQFTPQLVVHGQLQVGSTDGLYVQVNRTYKTGESYDWYFGDPSIVIWHGLNFTGPTVWNTGDDAHFGFYPRLAVSPGDTFDIVVAEQGFDTVRGRTVVPDTFRFLYPRDGDTVTLSDSLGWTRSRTAAGYYFSILTDYNGELSMYDVVIGNDSTGQGYDSTKVHFPRLFFYYGDKPGWKTLAVYAVDSNYFDWMRLVGYGAGGGTPPETTYLTGGLGVFGSAAVETLSFYLKTDTTSRTQPHYPTGAVEDKPDAGCQNAEVRIRQPGLPTPYPRPELR